MSENKEINIIGILIDAENFELYHVAKSWEHNEHEGTYSGHSASNSSSIKGLKSILLFLSLEKKPATQFVIVYDVTCSKKEARIEAFLSAIKEDPLLLSLVSIGHEESPLSKDITGQVSLIAEVANTENPSELLKNIVEEKIINVKKEIEFTSQLEVILEKGKQLRKNGHVNAADKADELYQSLTKRSKTYFSNPTEEAYRTFKSLSKDDIEKAHEELDKHRGWKQVLGNIGLAIVGVGVLYVIAGLINKAATGNFLFFKTDSANKLDQLEQSVNSINTQLSFLQFLSQ